MPGKQHNLVEVRQEFTTAFNTNYGALDPSLICNTDETVIYLDSLLSKNLSEKAARRLAFPVETGKRLNPRTSWMGGAGIANNADSKDVTIVP